MTDRQRELVIKRLGDLCTGDRFTTSPGVGEIWTVGIQIEDTVYIRANSTEHGLPHYAVVYPYPLTYEGEPETEETMTDHPDQCRACGQSLEDGAIHACVGPRLNPGNPRAETKAEILEILADEENQAREEFTQASAERDRAEGLLQLVIELQARIRKEVSDD